MPNIFDYREISVFLADALSHRSAEGHNLSLRQWSKRMGYENPSLLSEVIRGQRKINMKLARGIEATLPFTKREKAYFKLLALRDSCRSLEMRGVYEDIIANFEGAQQKEDVDSDTFFFLCEWLHSALFEMPALRDFRVDFDYLAKRIGRGANATSVKSAWERLIRLGLVEKRGDRYVRVPQNIRLTSDCRISLALRKLHKQMINKAYECIDDLPTEERYLSGSTIAINKKNYARIRELIDRFHTELHELAVDNGADDVYRVNTQFFPLTVSKHKERGQP